MDIKTLELANGVKVLVDENGEAYRTMSRIPAETRAAQLRAQGVEAFTYKHPAVRGHYVAIATTE